MTYCIGTCFKIVFRWKTWREILNGKLQSLEDNSKKIEGRLNGKLKCTILLQVYTAISIKVVHEQSGKVEYERERLLEIALKIY